MEREQEREGEREGLRGLQLTRNLAHVPGDSAVNHPGSYSALRVYVTSILSHPPTITMPVDPSVVSSSFPRSTWWRFVRIAFINIHVTHRQSLLIITELHTRLIKILLFRRAPLPPPPIVHFSSDSRLSTLSALPPIFIAPVIRYPYAAKFASSVISDKPRREKEVPL